jgi:hypothetical protein
MGWGNVMDEGPFLVGWIVFTVAPWSVFGPFEAFEEAVAAADAHGPASRLSFGERRGEICDFTPAVEPCGRARATVGASPPATPEAT